ncbi:MAG TPA: oligosaccharide flippase family protein [Candidatus Peribacteraceae bacterium]|nr:oligosaccharide flippase family protein [Candidatus Peribacteraceae bacterium]
MFDRAYHHWLHVLQRIVGIREKTMARNATIITISHGVGLLRGLITGYLVARLLPREMYGQYQFLLAAFGVAGFLNLPGIDTSLRRAVARGEKGVLYRVFQIHILISLIGTAALLIAIAFLNPDQRQTYWLPFVIAAVLFPVSQTSSTLFGALSVGEAKFKLSLIANIVMSALIALGALLILFLKPSALLLFVTVIAVPAVVYLAFSKRIMPPSDPHIPTKPILIYAAQLSFLALPLYFSTYVDKLMISALFGVKQLAVFSVATLIPENIKTWSKEILPISFAVQARGDNSLDRRWRLLLVVGRLTALALIPIALYIAFAPAIFAILFPNYPDAVFLTQVAGFFLITQPGAFLTQYLEAQKMLKALQWTQWLSSVFYLIALVTLLPAFGLIGAIVARGVLRLSSVLLALYFLLRPHPRDIAMT